MKIFISYSRSDRSAASNLAAILERLGYEVWWDHQIIAGDDFRGKIKNELDIADVVAVVWSLSSLKSSWVADEAERASDHGKLVPIILPDVEIQDLPIGLNKAHALFVKNANLILSESEKRQLVEAVTNVMLGNPGAYHRPTKPKLDLFKGFGRIATGITGLYGVSCLLAGGIFLWGEIERRGELSYSNLVILLQGLAVVSIVWFFFFGMGKLLAFIARGFIR